MFIISSSSQPEPASQASNRRFNDFNTVKNRLPNWCNHVIFWHICFFVLQFLEVFLIDFTFDWAFQLLVVDVE